MKLKNAAPLGASFVVLSSLFYASYGIWTKLTGDFFGGYTASAIRSVLVLLILIPLAMVFSQLAKLHWRRDWRQFAGLTLTSTLVWGPLYYAVLHAGVGISLTINYASIVIGMFFFGWLLARERFTQDKWLSTILGFVGLWMIFAPSTAGLGWLALSAALLSGFAAAAHYVIGKQLPYNATQTIIIMWCTSVIANAVMALALREHFPDVGPHMEWLYLFIFALASVAATWLLMKGMKLIEAGAAGILGLLEIVFGVMFGALFFAERPGALVLLGVAAIIVAAAIPYVRDYNAKRGTLDGTS
jgi:drug/metabolite transporter (DMT)-like permease